MRLRKKPWVPAALDNYADIVYKTVESCQPGHWRDIFGRSAPLHVELGVGRGRFITGMAARHPEMLFVGMEKVPDVLYDAACKARKCALPNLRLVLGDAGLLPEVFGPGEVDRLYLTFSDPWPKNRHAKRRLTHLSFLEKYRAILAPSGRLVIKTDNAGLFDFSLEQFALAGMTLVTVIRDLHRSELAVGNIMTEYENRFCQLGLPIYYCEALFPQAREPQNT